MSDYEIGRARPPGHTRFAKGVSGNSKGRPRGSRNHRNELKRELEAKVTVTENGKRRKVTTWEMMVKQQVVKAMKGDLKATDWLAKHAIRLGILDPAEQVHDFSARHKEVLNAYAGILDDASIVCVRRPAVDGKEE